MVDAAVRPAHLVGVVVGGGVVRWTRLGFAVSSRRFVAGDVAFEVTDDDALVVAWDVRVADGTPADLPLPHADVTAPTAAERAVVHPNGVVALDHVVVLADDLDALGAALAAAGSPARAEREAPAGDGDAPARLQRFHVLTTAVAELVGPAVAPPSPRPPRFWGLAFATPAVDDLATVTDGAAGPARPAIQPGRRIATATAVEGRAPAVAFLTPRP